MPTAAVACLDLAHGDWIDLAPATCELRWLVTPKTLKGNVEIWNYEFRNSEF